MSPLPWPCVILFSHMQLSQQLLTSEAKSTAMKNSLEQVENCQVGGVMRARKTGWQAESSFLFGFTLDVLSEPWSSSGNINV